ncbi:MAG: CBS domain-containing protein [Bacteroidales bacterium]|nr:CBS domain-containing protein [Bacteroidales bacterium]MBN2697306.1 CBS domain-containing protein [Bacteroidales bacterium]
MLARELISETVPALKTSDTGVQALTWMEIFRVKHLPIVNHREFLGLISDQDIYDLNDPDEPIGNHHLSLQKPYVEEDQHIYEVIEVVSRLELTLVPVLNAEKHFLGVITQEDLTKVFSNLSGMQHPGGIIVLEMNNNDYSLTEISNIVESNDARILSLYVSSSDDASKLRVTLKLNITDLTSILETFNRYSYHVFASYMSGENLDEFYQDRFDGFLNYLNI